MATPGALTTWYTGGDNAQHIAYISYKFVVSLFRRPGQLGWAFDDPDYGKPGESGPAAAGALTNWFSYSDNLQHIACIIDADDGYVQELFMPPGQPPWGKDYPSDIAGLSQPQRGALISWWSTSDNTQHIVYIDGNGHVQELYVRPGQPPWQSRDVTDDIKAPRGQWAQAGALTSWWSTSDNLQHIAYIDRNGHVQDCYMQPGNYPWRVYDVSNDASPPRPQAGALTSWWSTSDNTQHIAYIDGNGHVQELYVRPGQPPWQSRDVIDDIKAPRGQWAQAGALTTWWSPVDGLRHIAYIDRNGHIQDCYMQPGNYPWRVYDVSNDASPPKPFAGALTSWWSFSDNTQHIAYIADIDDYGFPQELYVRPGQPPWRVAPIVTPQPG